MQEVSNPTQENPALTNAYKLAQSKGYKKDINSFKTLISSDETALNNIYNEVKTKGYKKDITEFSSLLGLKEKDESVSTVPKPKSESVPQNGSLVGTKRDTFTEQITQPDVFKNEYKTIDGKTKTLKPTSAQNKNLEVANKAFEYAKQNVSKENSLKKINDEVDNNQWTDKIAQVFKNAYNTSVGTPLTLVNTLLGGNKDFRAKKYVPLEREKKQALKDLEQEKKSDKSVVINDEIISERAKQLFIEKDMQEQMIQLIDEALPSGYDREGVWKELKLESLRSNDALRSAVASAEVYKAQMQELDNFYASLTPEEKKNGVSGDRFKELEDVREKAKQAIKGLEYLAKNFDNYLQKANTDQEKLELFKYNYNDFEKETSLLKNSAKYIVGGTVKLASEGLKFAANNLNQEEMSTPLNAMSEIGSELMNEAEKDNTQFYRYKASQINSWSDLGSFVFQLGAEQIPILASIYLGGTTGLVAVSASSGGQKINQLEEDAKKPFGRVYSDGEKLLAGLLYAGAEYFPGVFGTARILKDLEKTVSAASTASRRMFTDSFLKTTYKGLGKTAYNVGLEGGTELITAEGQITIDQELLGVVRTQAEKNEMRFESGVAGGLMGGVMTMTGGLIGLGVTQSKLYSDKKDIAEVQKIFSQINAINDEIENNQNLTDAERKDLYQQNNKLNNEAFAIVEKNAKKGIELPIQAKSFLVEVNQRQTDLKAKAKEVSNSNFSESIKKAKIKELENEFNSLEEKRNSTLEGGYNSLTELSDKEVVRLKNLASRELMKEKNPDGTKTITLNENEISKRAVQIYNSEVREKAKVNEQKPTNTTPESKPLAESEKVDIEKTKYRIAELNNELEQNRISVEKGETTNRSAKDIKQEIADLESKLPKEEEVDKKKSFTDAGNQSKKDQSPKALGDFIIDNSQIGDKIRINEDSYYEVASKKTNKKGQTETELQFFAKNDDTGIFENIPSAVKLFTDKYRGTDQEKLGYRDAANLFESSYTNSNGEKVVEQSTYEPKSLEVKPTNEVNDNAVLEENNETIPNPSQIKKGFYSQEEIDANNEFYDNIFNEISDEIEKKLKEKGEYSFEKLSQELQKDKRIIENDKNRNKLYSHNNKIIKSIIFNAIENIDLKGRFYGNNLKNIIQENLKTTLSKRFLLENEDINISEKLIGSFEGKELEGIKQDFVNVFLPPGTRFNDLSSDQKSEALEKTKDLFDKFITDISESIVKNTEKEIAQKQAELKALEQPTPTTQSESVAVENVEAKIDVSGIGTENYKNKKSQVVGRKREITIADGSKIKGQYKVVSADDILASHNEDNFSKTNGYPVNERGETINDRDYEKDKNAQVEVVKIAQDYDGRAIQQTPVVTTDGIVVDGNNRVMSRKLAAKKGTDGKYKEALIQEADMYGIDPDAISAIKNPIMVFEAERNLPYTTETLSKFNKQDKKEKSSAGKAVEYSKTLSDKAKRQIAEVYDSAERPSDVTSDPKSVKQLRDILLNNNIIQSNEIPRYFDVDKNVMTKEGVSLMENIALGSVFNEKTINTLSIQGMGDIRNKILQSLVGLINNGKLDSAYQLGNEIAKAIEVIYQLKTTKQTIEQYLDQPDIFGEKFTPNVDEYAVILAISDAGFKKWLQNYNNNVGQPDIFKTEGDGITTKRDKSNETITDRKKQVPVNLRSDAQRNADENGQQNGAIEGEIENEPNDRKDVENQQPKPEQAEPNVDENDEFDNSDLEDDSEAISQGFLGSSNQNQRDLLLSDNGPVKFRFPFQRYFKRVWANTFKSNSGLNNTTAEVVRSRNRTIAAFSDHINSEVNAFHKIIKAVKNLDKNNINNNLLSINDYLAGKKGADVSFLSQEQINQLDYFRDRITGLSQSLIDMLEDNLSKIKSSVLDSAYNTIETYFNKKYKDNLFSQNDFNEMIKSNENELSDLEKTFAADLINKFVNEKGISVENASNLVNAFIFKNKEKFNTKISNASIDSTQNLINTIKANMDTYITRNYQIFSDDNYRNIITGDFKNINKEGQLRMRNAINFLIREEGMSRNEATEAVAEYLADIRKGKSDFQLSSNGDAVSNFFKKRKNIPLEFRKLLGESKDPVYNYVNTVYKISHYLGNIEYQSKLRENLIANNIASTEAKLGYVKLADGDGWKILNDIYVPVEFKEAFEDMQPLKTIESSFYKAWIKFAGYVKLNKTVLSPNTMAKNLFSGVFLGANSGHLFLMKPERIAEAFNQALTTKISQTQLFDERQKLIKLGVLGDGVNSGELMAILNDFSKEVDRMISKNTTEKVFDFAKKLYAFGDDFYKVAGFYIETDNFIKSGMSKAEAEKKAAYRINNGYPTYSYLPKNMQRLRRVPLVGTFVSFPYEAIRTTKNNLLFVKEDIEAGRNKMAFQRATGMIVANATLSGLSMLTMSMLGISDEDDDAIRDMLPEWQRNSKLIYIGTKNGKPMFIDGTAFFASETLMKPISTLFEQRAGRDFDNKLKQSLNEILSPYISQDISFKTLMSVSENENEYNQKIYQSNNLFDAIFNESDKIINFLMKQAGPGVYNNATEFMRANEIGSQYVGDKFSSYGKEYTNQEALLGLFGMRLSVINYSAAMSSFAYQVKDSESADKSSASKLVKTSKLLEKDEVESIVKDYAKYHEVNYKKMLNIVNAGKKMGMTDDDIEVSLKSSKLSNKAINDLLKNKIPELTPLSTQSIKQFKQKIAINYKGDKNIKKILVNFYKNKELFKKEIEKYNKINNKPSN